MKRDYFYWLGFILLFAIVFFSCEPAVTKFEDEENAFMYASKNIKVVPDTFTIIKVMTWNIRFGIGRNPWFGDACGYKVVFDDSEIYPTLQLIADKINEIQPDVLLLQEVDIDSKRSAYVDQLQWILDHTYFNYAAYGSQWKAQFIPSDGLGRMDEGNVILSRWPMSDAKRIQLPLRNDQDALTKYFYERCSIVKAKLEIPNVDDLYIVNIHASAFATDDTKFRHIQIFKSEMDKIKNNGDWVISGGDLNTLPPGSDTTDYCLQDICEGESFHGTGDDPLHKEGSNYEPEQSWLLDIYENYQPAVNTSTYLQNQYKYFTHTTRPNHFWDRTLDYLFSNEPWLQGTIITHQDCLPHSDHAPVSCEIKLKFK